MRPRNKHTTLTASPQKSNQRPTRQKAHGTKSPNGDLVQKLQAHQRQLEQQNKELWETLFDRSPIGYVVLKMKGTRDHILKVNVPFCQLVGTSPRDLFQYSFSRFFNHTDRSSFRRHLNSLTSSSGPQTSEILVLRSKDCAHWVCLTSCVGTLGSLNQDPLYWIAVLDVTEQERACRLNENILQSAKEGIVGLDQKGKVAFSNRSCERLTGWKASELMGHPLHEMLHHTKPDGSHYPKKECPIRRTLNHGESLSLESEFLWRKNGTPFPVEYISTPILNESGQVEGAVVTFRDITERKQAEELLRNSRDQLGQQQAELYALTAKLFTVQEEERAKIAHELHDDINQRLALLQIKLQMTLPVQPNPQYQEIIQEVERLSDDIRNLAHHYHPSILQDLGLHKALRALVADYEKGGDLTITLTMQKVPQNLPPLVTRCVYRVVQESFQNILKHAQATAVQCTLRRDAEGLSMKIQDDGVGFSKTSSPSTGLGLLSMEERARALQGRLTIDSKPRKGTLIDLWLPVHEKSEGQPGLHKAIPSAKSYNRGYWH